MKKGLKLFLCIVISVLVVNFLMNVYLFILQIPNYSIAMHMASNMGKGNLDEFYLSSLDNVIEKMEEQNGEDYPTLEEWLSYYFYSFSSYMIVNGFIESLIIGIAIGATIYLLFFCKTSGWTLIIGYTSIFIAMIGMSWIIDILYETILELVNLSSEYTRCWVNNRIAISRL